MRAAIEALNSASACGSGGVFRTFSGASSSRLSGIFRMSGSALEAMWFMPFCMEGCIDATGTASLASYRACPDPEFAPASDGA